MTHRPGVSVLIPCRNAEKFLDATLASAVNQTERPLEIIVVDDGSTDRSLEIASGFGSLVTVVGNPGQGVSAARNHASSIARGDYFQYLDADDLLTPHAIESRVQALEGSGANVAVSDWERLVSRDNDWQAERSESGRLPENTAPDLAVFQGFWAPPAAILYRRSVWERVGGWHESLPVIQDARFLFDAARVCGGFVHVRGVGAQYRQHASQSLSSTAPGRFWRDVLQNTREVEQLWEADGVMDAPHRAALAKAYVHCARVGFIQDESLFTSTARELTRFVHEPLTAFVRAAMMLTGLTGYTTARAVLSPFCR